MVLAVAITAYAQGPGGGSRCGYGKGGNGYGMMGGHGMMGGFGAGNDMNGMMDSYGHGDQNRYDRDTANPYSQYHRDYRYDRDTANPYSQRHRDNRYDPDTMDRYRRSPMD